MGMYCNGSKSNLPSDLHALLARDFAYFLHNIVAIVYAFCKLNVFLQVV